MSGIQAVRAVHAVRFSRKTVRGHAERHRNARIGWLRAAVLGANDGIVSTASLIVGVAAAVANAVYHATGKRVRDLPITIEKLL